MSGCPGGECGTAIAGVCGTAYEANCSGMNEMNNDIPNDIPKEKLEPLEMKLRYLENKYHLIKTQYEKTVEEYLGILNDVSRVYDRLCRAAAARGEECGEGEPARRGRGARMKERTEELMKVKEELRKEMNERRRVENSLRESEEKYRKLVESLKDIIYILDERGIMTYISPVVESVAGYKPSEVIGRPFTEFVHHEDIQRMIEDFQRILSGSPSMSEYRVLTRSGETLWMLASARPLIRGDRLVEIHGVLTDITERKRTEEALKRAHDELEIRIRERTRELAAAVGELSLEVAGRRKAQEAMEKAEERLRDFLDSSPDGYALLDSELNFVEINKTGLDALKKSRKEVIGRNLLEVVPSFRETGRYEMYREVLKTGEPVFLEDVSPAAEFGENLRVSLRVFKVGECLGVIVTDITERKAAENALMEERAKLERMLEHKSLLAYVASHLNSAYSLEDVINELLGAVASSVGTDRVCIYGFDSEDGDVSLLGAHGEESCAEFPDAGGVFLSLAGRVRDGGGFSFPGVDAGDAERRFFAERGIASLCMFPLNVVDEVMGCICCCRKSGRFDAGELNLIGTISDMISNAWAREIHMQARLAAEEKRIEAVRMAEQASRFASIGVIAAGITHEINQPLTAIKITADSILYWEKKNKGILPEKFVSMQRKISDNVNRITEVIRHMRSFWVSPDKIEKKTVDLNEAVKNTLALLNRQLHSHGIEPEILLYEPSVPVLGNILHLEQIVINLVVNAMNTLDRIERKIKKIRIVTRRKGDKAVLKVIDNGTGIPKGIRDRIFDPFFSTKKHGEGMGLGLAIVKRFVDEHGGVITVRNNPRYGVTFTVEFPVSGETEEMQDGNTSRG